MKVKVLDHLKDGKKIELGSGKTFRTVFRTVDRETCGSELLASGITYFEPGTSSSVHSHLSSEEINLVIKGSGILESEGERLPFKAMDYLFIPKGVEHRHHNTGKETLVLLWLYTPPGELPRD
jgi:mannose-6-phosphate isomerase-like protein (cupin superfamily)